jgi:hypothetical protein
LSIASDEERAFDGLIQDRLHGILEDLHFLQLVHCIHERVQLLHFVDETDDIGITLELVSGDLKREIIQSADSREARESSQP